MDAVNVNTIQKQAGVKSILFTPRLVLIHSVDFAVQTQNQLIKPLISIGLGYFRWTQLTPMILFWGAGIVMLMAMTFVNFQAQSFSILEWFLEWLVELPIVGDDFRGFLTEESQDLATQQAQEPDQGQSIHVDTNDFTSILFRAWAVMSLIFMLLGMAVSAQYGPFKPWSLKRKIGFMGLAVLVLLAGFIANYFADPDNFNGGAGGWIFNFSMISLLIFIVSVYSLTLSHIVQMVSDGIMKSELKIKDDPRKV
jgi:hypothetical protein